MGHPKKNTLSRCIHCMGHPRGHFIKICPLEGHLKGYFKKIFNCKGSLGGLFHILSTGWDKIREFMISTGGWGRGLRPRWSSRHGSGDSPWRWPGLWWWRHRGMIRLVAEVLEAVTVSLSMCNHDFGFHWDLCLQGFWLQPKTMEVNGVYFVSNFRIPCFLCVSLLSPTKYIVFKRVSFFNRMQFQRKSVTANWKILLEPILDHTTVIPDER